MNTDGTGKFSALQGSECRNKNSQGINYDDSSVDLDVDPFQRLKRHFSSVNNRSIFKSKKIKVPSIQHEKSLIAMDILDENLFDKALVSVKLCLEKEDYSKETADHFFSLIQSIDEHVKHIKQRNEDIVKKVDAIKYDKKKLTSKALYTCDKIKTILNLSYPEKLCNYLTESQKEDIEKFKKLFDEFCEQVNENYVFCEDLNAITSMTSSSPSKENSCISVKREQIQQLLAEKNKLLEELATVKEKHAKLTEANTDIASPHCQNQAKLIAILSPFLYVHSLSGQSVAEILSYFKSLGYCISQQEIENLLISYPSVFRQSESSEGHADEKKWIFCGCDI